MSNINVGTQTLDQIFEPIGSTTSISTNTGYTYWDSATSSYKDIKHRYKGGTANILTGIKVGSQDISTLFQAKTVSNTYTDTSTQQLYGNLNGSINNGQSIAIGSGITRIYYIKLGKIMSTVYTGTKTVTITRFTIDTNTDMNSFTSSGTNTTTDVNIYALSASDLPNNYPSSSNYSSDPGVLLGSSLTNTMTISANKSISISSNDYIYIGFVYSNQSSKNQTFPARVTSITFNYTYN
jgi:hypothetical protein